MSCPVCEGSSKLIETVKPRLNSEGMMIPVPMRYWRCDCCGCKYTESDELNFNAMQAHLLLNQFSDLENKI